jgi:hypothetical protein
LQLKAGGCHDDIGLQLAAEFQGTTRFSFIRFEWS